MTGSLGRASRLSVSVTLVTPLSDFGLVVVEPQSVRDFVGFAYVDRRTGRPADRQGAGTSCRRS